MHLGLLHGCVSEPFQGRGKGVGHLRAPDELSNVVNAVGQLSQLLATRQAGCNVTETCQVLAEDHGANQAVVTGRVGDALLVLDSPSGRCHTLGEADKDLQVAKLLQELMTSCCLGLSTRRPYSHR